MTLVGSILPRGVLLWHRALHQHSKIPPMRGQYLEGSQPMRVLSESFNNCLSPPARWVRSAGQHWSSGGWTGRTCWCRGCGSPHSGRSRYWTGAAGCPGCPGYTATGCFTPGQDEDRDNIKTLSVCLLLYLYGIKELETA